MESIKDLFGNYRLAIPTGKKITERGELLKMFSTNTGYSIPFIAHKVQGLGEKDLYYIKSVCDGETREGRKENWKHAFNTEIKRIWNPQKYG